MTIEQVKAMQWWNRLPEHVKKMLNEKYKTVEYESGRILPVNYNVLVNIYACEEHRFPLVQQWEYTNFNPSSYVSLDVLKFINNLGSQGWELVTISSHGTYTFKRPKQE